MIKSNNVFGKLSLMAAIAVLGQVGMAGNVSATTYDQIAQKYAQNVVARTGSTFSSGSLSAVQLDGGVVVVGGTTEGATLSVGVSVDSGDGKTVNYPIIQFGPGN